MRSHLNPETPGKTSMIFRERQDSSFSAQHLAMVEIDVDSIWI